MSTKSQEEAYITVSELNHLLNASLEEQFPMVRFQGEISEITFAKSGHIYYRVKDSDAQIEAVMWRGSVGGLNFKPDRGVLVLCEGRPNVYRASGRLQIIVNRMFEAGEGLLQKKFLQLKEKLEKEGLFAPERKRALPFFPQAIGVVTSATGAVIHDIMVRIQDRMPQLKVFLVDVRVQGDGAAKEIAEGIRQLNELGGIDAIIVGRGGGSLEDLWAFNEEEVVRAIFASKVPIISSVGHEVDVTLSDLVADVRAPTPTAAAEMVVPKRSELLARIDELGSRILAYERWFPTFEQKLDEVELRMARQSESLLERLRLVVEKAKNQVNLLEPHRVIDGYKEKVTTLYRNLEAKARELVQFDGNRLKVASSKLDTLNPFNVLNRGYSLVQRGDEVVREAKSLKVGDDLKITFATGGASSKVVEIFQKD